MLYDSGGKIQITNTCQVLCDGRLIGRLRRSVDDEKQWWDLVAYDEKRVYLHDGVYSKIAQTESIQEIGEYLDNHFAGG